jgi:hypothetical protein
MERYIGMDVHAASCTLAVISEGRRALLALASVGLLGMERLLELREPVKLQP